jgi:RNA polymerase sigma factor (sigma-70 family)
MREATDTDLLGRFLTQRDSTAFETLFVRHRRWIFNLCRRFLRSHALAEDATQEVFTRCAERAGSLDGENVAGWLKAIAVNHCLNVIEKERRWTPLDPAMTLTSATPGQEREAIAREQADRARRAIERLPKHQKLVFCLKYLDGCSYQEIERLTGFSAKQVKSFLQNARRNFDLRWLAEETSAT